MKLFLISILTLNVLLVASSTKNKENERKVRVEKQIQKEIEKERRYAQENSFYINLKGAEVNEESLDYVPDLELDDLDMDSVYD